MRPPPSRVLDPKELKGACVVPTTVPLPGWGWFCVLRLYSPTEAKYEGK